MANNIAPIVHCTLEWNLANIGTKVLPGHVHQRLMHNQVLPPFKYSRECWKEQQNLKVEGMQSPAVIQGESRDEVSDLSVSSTPMLTLKYSRFSCSMDVDGADYHVEDLAFAFQDDQFKCAMFNAKF